MTKDEIASIERTIEALDVEQLAELVTLARNLALVHGEDGDELGLIARRLLDLVGAQWTERDEAILTRLRERRRD